MSSVLAGSPGAVEHVRQLSVTVVRLSNFDGEDHDGDGIFGVCREDLFKQPVPVKLRTAPALIPLLTRD